MVDPDELVAAAAAREVADRILEWERVVRADDPTADHMEVLDRALRLGLSQLGFSLSPQGLQRLKAKLERARAETAATLAAARAHTPTPNDRGDSTSSASTPAR